MTGLVTARQLGADYPFRDDESRKWFNFYGRMMYGWRFRKARSRSGRDADRGTAERSIRSDES